MTSVCCPLGPISSLQEQMSSSGYNLNNNNSYASHLVPAAQVSFRPAMIALTRGNEYLCNQTPVRGIGNL